MSLQRRIRSSVLFVVAVMAAASGVILWNQGTLRREFENMTTCGELEQYLLECRRHEKNFFLRGDPQYLALFKTYFGLLQESTDRLRANPLIQERIVHLVAKELQYKEKFEALAAQETPAAAEAMSDMVRVARECHSLIREIREAAIEHFQTTSSTTQFINFVSVLLGIVLSVFVAGYIGDRVLAWAHREEL